MTATTTVVFAVGSSDANDLARRVTTAFPSATFDAQATWSMSNTFYRATTFPSANPSNTNKHMLILQLSGQPGRTLICIGADTGATEAVSIDSGSASSDFSRLLQNKFGPLWQPLRNWDIRISNGMCWDAGLFRVQSGELSRDRGVTGGGLETRGTLIIVSILAEAQKESGDFEEEKEMLSEFCQALGLESSQQSPKILAEAWGSFASWKGEATLWCDILRRVVSSGSSGRPKSTEP